jgi:hypothetical protein
MSGAGRGTPRVSPTTDALPQRPGGGSQYGNIEEITNAKFIFTISENTSQDLTDTFEDFIWSDSSGSAFINIPEGLTRGEINCEYTEGSASGRMQMRFRWSTSIPLFPSTQSNSGDLTLSTMRDLVYEFSFSGESVKIPFVIPVTGSLRVEVREVGDTANPGSVDIQFLSADNLSDISIIPNVTV